MPQSHSNPDSPSRASAAPLIIGLAGGVGAGKSAAAAAFADLGAVVLDADSLAKETLQRPEIRTQLTEWWGAAVLDPGSGRINTRAVADIIFNNPEERARLEALIHPIVIQRQEDLIASAAASGAKAVVIDAPLLFEAGVHRRCDAVVFIDAPVEQRLRRTAKRPGWGPGELARREKSQSPLEKKREMSHYVVRNDAGPAELVGRIRDVFQAIMSGQRRGSRE